MATAGQCSSTPSTPDAEQNGGGPDHFPGDQWQQYADVADAGFSERRLAAARKFWEKRNPAALMVVSRGAVVAAWGDVERRFYCHSIRKSFLSALYGVYEDDIDLTATIGTLDLDDEPPLTEQEKQARVVDLISARSGVYHEAAAEPDEMSRNRPQRGSHEPGSFWWYNNWDINAAGAIFERRTGERIFEAFAQKIAAPISMQDFRVTDGFYHYEREKSVFPAYMFRMSTRDLARFGLLFARNGRWQEKQVLPESWVGESTRSHSKTDLGAKYGNGYAYMWWVDEPRGYTARGSGGHILGVYPERDLVIVLRADTFHDRSISTRAAMRLFEMILDAGGGSANAAPRLIPMADEEKSSSAAILGDEALTPYAGEVDTESGRKIKVALADGALTIDYGYGTFRLRPESATRFIAEDSGDPFLFELAEDGHLRQIWSEQLAYLEAGAAFRSGDNDAAVAWVANAVEKFPESARAHYNFARALQGQGKGQAAMAQLREALAIDPDYDAAQDLLRILQIRRFGWILGLLFAAGLLSLTIAFLRRRNARPQGPR